MTDTCAPTNIIYFMSEQPEVGGELSVTPHQLFEIRYCLSI